MTCVCRPRFGFVDVYMGRVTREGVVLAESSQAEPPEDTREDQPNVLCVLVKSAGPVFSAEAARSNKRR